MDGGEIQAPVRREHADESVVEKIKASDAPVVVFWGGQLLKCHDRKNKAVHEKFIFTNDVAVLDTNKN